MKTEKKKNSIPILEKALDVMEYIAAGETPVRMPELQENLGIAQASCYRIVSTLVDRGWLEKCSGNRYEIAAGLVRVTDKIKFRLEKYKHLQPAMNRIANLVGFSAKLSVRDGDEFVNVCSAHCREELLSFSEPGFRSPLSRIATVSTIFLAEDPAVQRQRTDDEKTARLFRKLSSFYKKHGYSFIHGETDENMDLPAEYPFDTLSFPVKRGEELLGVISFLSLPGVLAGECDRVAAQMKTALRGIINSL